MSDESVATVRIRRPSRVDTDGGRNVWVDTIEEVELELVSTGELQAILESGDEDARGAIRRALSGQQEGVLARDPATGLFQVISESDLKRIPEDDDAPIRRRPADVTLEPASEAAGEEEESQELSLVSTRMLRTIIESDEKPARPGTGVKPKAKDRSGGFDPYDSG